jgi:hypothetical protein
LPEFADKLDRLRRWLAAEGCGAVELTRYCWLAWLFGGAEARVLAAAERGVCLVRITADCVVIVANNIEAPRLREEEGLGDLPVEWVVQNWWDPPPGDPGFEPPAWLRLSLLPEEIDRARRVSADAAEAIETAARSLRPGLTEHEIAGRMAQQAFARGLAPVALFVAADERGRQYRHPIPTARIAQRNAILSLVARRGGLHASVTRTVSFGPACESMRHRHRAVSRVHAAMLAASRPGATLGDVVAAARRAYAEQGFPDEWRHHHQGGLIGYEPREIRAAPDCRVVLEAGRLVAWNPTVRGAKSEETALVTPNGVELLTSTGQWPPLPEPLPLADILVL